MSLLPPYCSQFNDFCHHRTSFLAPHYRRGSRLCRLLPGWFASRLFVSLRAAGGKNRLDYTHGLPNNGLAPYDVLPSPSPCSFQRIASMCNGVPLSHLPRYQITPGLCTMTCKIRVNPNILLRLVQNPRDIVPPSSRILEDLTASPPRL